jgi:hypothetical protein
MNDCFSIYHQIVTRAVGAVLHNYVKLFCTLRELSVLFAMCKLLSLFTLQIFIVKYIFKTYTNKHESGEMLF